jgi:DNA-binding response OmpR family regulator
MPDRPFPSGTRVPEIILHERRLHVSETQARMLIVLLAHAGHLVPDAELLASQQGPARDRARLWRAVSRLRAPLAAHGFVISRVRHAGYRLVPEEEVS